MFISTPNLLNYYSILFRQFKHDAQWVYWKTHWTPHYNSSFIVHKLYSFLFNLCKVNVALHLFQDEWVYNCVHPRGRPERELMQWPTKCCRSHTGEQWIWVHIVRCSLIHGNLLLLSILEESCSSWWTWSAPLAHIRLNISLYPSGQGGRLSGAAWLVGTEKRLIKVIHLSSATWSPSAPLSTWVPFEEAALISGLLRCPGQQGSLF